MVHVIDDRHLKKTLIVLRDIPWLGLGDSNNHTLELGSEDNLAAQPGVLVQNPCPRIPLQNVLFVIGGRRQLLEPLLSDMDLAFSRTCVNVFKAVRFRVD